VLKGTGQTFTRLQVLIALPMMVFLVGALLTYPLMMVSLRVLTSGAWLFGRESAARAAGYRIVAYGLRARATRCSTTTADQGDLIEYFVDSSPTSTAGSYRGRTSRSISSNASTRIGRTFTLSSQ
jgi:hypothetical protein